MKLLLIMGSDKIYNTFVNSLKLPGYEFIRYRHVQKAMDNIEEADPSGIIISATDFPRHWKTLVSFVRSERPKSSCPIIVLKGDAFPEEEANKAEALEIDCLASELFESPAETEKIQSLFGSQKAADSGPKENAGEAGGSLAFVFSNPEDEKIITGTVKTVTAASLSFAPDHPAMVENLKPNTKLPNCSFRSGTKILSPSCIVRKTGKILELEFA